MIALLLALSLPSYPHFLSSLIIINNCHKLLARALTTNMQKLIKLWKTESAKGRKVCKIKLYTCQGRKGKDRGGRNCGQPRVKFDLLIYKTRKTIWAWALPWRGARGVCCAALSALWLQQGGGAGGVVLQGVCHVAVTSCYYLCGKFSCFNRIIVIHFTIHNKINWNVGKHVKINYTAHVTAVCVCV